MVLAAAFVSMLLLVTFDLDRPTRGVVTVPATPLVALRASMELPPAAEGPGPLAASIGIQAMTGSGGGVAGGRAV